MVKLEKATFAGGCFWCMQPAFKKLPGIRSVVAGYANGMIKQPSYERVCSGSTGHREAVQITFDAGKTSYEGLLNVFWKNINPEDNRGQFADKGFQYASAIFYHTEQQQKIAEESKKKLLQSGKFRKIATVIEKFRCFYPAEEEHQDYAEKNPLKYQTYALLSGRKHYLEEVWGRNGKKTK